MISEGTDTRCIISIALKSIWCVRHWQLQSIPERLRFVYVNTCHHGDQRRRGGKNKTKKQGFPPSENRTCRSSFWLLRLIRIRPPLAFAVGPKKRLWSCLGLCFSCVCVTQHKVYFFRIVDRPRVPPPRSFFLCRVAFSERETRPLAWRTFDRFYIALEVWRFAS